MLLNTSIRPRRTGPWLVLVALTSWPFAPAPAAGATPPKTRNPAAVEYNRDIRPILSDHCFLCHGPDRNTRKAKLRLDLRDEALQHGAFVPGKPEVSELVKRVFSADADEMMPPPAAHKPLSTAQKEILQRWIAEGAEYQPHWAYLKPSRPGIPAVKNRQAVANAIDALLLHPLEDRQLGFAREADRRTLLRRLSLDLIGLPPTAQEMQAFLADRSEGAYARQVERLLASPHYGERMAVPWLDTARFTDTVGYHGDQNQRVFPYRDYVIAAFNRNKPFDEFTIEQLAGDLLPHPTDEQLIATGFNRLNMMTREGGAQPREYLAKYSADRVRTVGTTWLGSTVGCAECHDHKFDPFTMRDFYSLEAFFADVKQWGVYQDYDYTPNPDLKGWSNDHPFPPELEVTSAALQERAQKLHTTMAALFASLPATRSSGDQPGWETNLQAFLSVHPDGWQALAPTPPPPAPPTVSTVTNVVLGVTNLVTKTNPPAKPTMTLEPGRSFRVAFGGKKDEEKIELGLAAGTIGALRLERWLQAAEAGTLRLSARLRHGKDEKDITFFRATASHHLPRYFNGEEVLGILSGWRPDPAITNAPQIGVWLPEPPIVAQEGDVLTVTLRSSAPLTARLSVSPLAMVDPFLSDPVPRLRRILAAAPASRSPAERADLAGACLLGTQTDTNAFRRFKGLQSALDDCRGGRTHTLVTVSTRPLVTRVLPRGNWQNDSGEIVQPSPPRFLLPADRQRSTGSPAVSAGSADETRLTRLDLARWLTSRDNPLTARVFMNRLWKQFFGTGLSAVVDDVGSQGEWPSHPALLDWLAVEFMESGWDIKHMVRLIVHSHAYRQDSNLRPEVLALDPQNRWLSSQNPRRLEAEFVRDNALFVAGLLNLDIGGASAHPYQPAGYYANLQFPDRTYAADPDDRQYRRGLYTHWQRTFLHPMLANFDAPAREECTAQRTVSNTPQQALTLLNDPTFTEAARVFAARILTPPRLSDRARMDRIFQDAIGRAPRAPETASLLRLLGAQRAHYANATDEADALLRVGLAPIPETVHRADLAAWTQVCRVVLNLHESITRY